MGGVTLVLFDIDGTLVNCGGRGREAMSAAARDLFGLPGMFEGLSFAGAVDSGIVSIALDQAGVGATPRNLGRMRSTYQRRLVRALRESPGTLCPGVPEVVSAVAGRAKVGLLTGNWPGGARVKLRSLGLYEHFAGCVGAFGDDASDRNLLVPIAVRRANRRWGSVRRVVVIGDTPADVRCARAGQALMGVDGPDVLAVAVETGFAPPERLEQSKPDLQLTDLESGLGALLALLQVGEAGVDEDPLVR